MAKLAEQAESRVWERRVEERIARKNEALFWRRSEAGTQDRKVVLDKNVVKKVGQEGTVKLLPREVSKGEGSGVVMTVIEANVEVERVEEEDSLARLSKAVVVGDRRDVVGTTWSVDGADVVIALVSLASIIAAVGDSRESTCIRPCLASCL